jgi:hypothetical protein
MSLIGVQSYLQIFLSCCLLVGYAFTLRHNLQGPKFPLVSQLICLLMLSNVGSIGCAFGTFELYVNKNMSNVFVWITAISFAVQDCPFNVSHHMLAMKYQEISNTVPLML